MARAAWRMPGYRVEELIGSGASGEVWLGRVNATGAHVALKRIWLADKAQRKAALAEAAMLATLDHPHVMKLHDVRHVDDDVVLVLDLASGGSLAALLERRGRLTVGEVVTAIAPIAAALAYAHTAGVVHGDVSAGNILFTDIGLPLLADLGVARLLGDAAPVRTTPVYADPMLATGVLPVPESDVFMLGAVALHALTGAPPWPPHVTPEFLDEITCGPDPDFAERLAQASVPEPVAAVVVRALTIDTARRGTAADFALELRHAAEPVAVELSAGRGRRAVMSSSGQVDSWPLQPLRPVETPAAEESVPVPPFASEQPLTYGVRAPSPFASSGRHLAREPRLTVATGPAIGATVLALVVAAVLWWLLGGAPDRADRTAGTGRAPAAASRPAPSPAAAAQPPAPAAALVALDRTRARAYARRDPALLAEVYASAALLARDRAQLAAIVPPGCGLHGATTAFSNVVVAARSPRTIRLQVTATLAPSTLLCGGTPSGRAPGAAAARLQVELVQVGDGYRIATQRRA